MLIEADIKRAAEDYHALTELIVEAITPGWTAEQLAKAAFEAVKKVAQAAGQNPRAEVFCWRPGTHNRSECKTAWWTVWEAGPFDWGTFASNELSVRLNRNVETYYGCDLMFYPEEDAR